MEFDLALPSWSCKKSLYMHWKLLAGGRKRTKINASTMSISQSRILAPAVTVAIFRTTWGIILNTDYDSVDRLEGLAIEEWCLMQANPRPSPCHALQYMPTGPVLRFWGPCSKLKFGALSIDIIQWIFILSITRYIINDRQMQPKSVSIFQKTYTYFKTVKINDTSKHTNNLVYVY